MASVASSAMSAISVAFNGQVMTLEESPDETMLKIQKQLNNLHVEMRRLAALTEQEINEEEDFRELVLFKDSAYDLVYGTVRLLEVFIFINFLLR